MIDQSHNVEGKIDAMVQSVMNIQTAYAKALLVDEHTLGRGAGRGRRARRAPRVARGIRDRRSTRSSPVSAPTPAWRQIRSPRSAPAITQPRAVRERGIASVESAYESS